MNGLKLGLLVLAALAGFTAGCGGGSGNGMAGGGSGEVSCTQQIMIGATTDMTCQEFPASEATEAQKNCNTSLLADAGLVGGDGGLDVNEVFANAPCSRMNAVGGCMVTLDGFTATTWFYNPPFDSSIVMSACSGSGTFVSP